MSGQPPVSVGLSAQSVRFNSILVVRKLEREKGFAVVAIQVEVTAIDDVHADDGIVVAKVLAKASHSVRGVQIPRWLKSRSWACRFCHSGALWPR